MARIKLLGQDDVPENARPYLQQQQETYGTVLNSTAFAAYFPGMMAASRELGNAIDKGELPAEFRRLLNVKVASQIGCPF